MSGRPSEGLQEIFDPDGLLARRLPRYEYRPSQRAMAEAVLEAIQNRHTLCVEAGTGTGKTLAYLIPALFSEGRVLISTATRNLQDQIFLKDIPFIREHLFPELSATIMKGRQNYLCLKKLYDPDPLADLREGSKEEREALKEWAEASENGERSELAWMPEENSSWPLYDASSDHCTGQKCGHFDRCFITRMRQKALESDLVVVNHALFFSNLALETDEIGRILPNFSVLILDEAHEIEDIAANHFGRHVSNRQIEDLCRDLSRLFQDSQTVLKAIDRLQSGAARLFDSLPPELGRHSLNLYPDQRGGTVDLRQALLDPAETLQAAILSLYHHLLGTGSRPPDAEPLIRRLEAAAAIFQDIFDPEQTGNVYWYERRARGVFLHANPIDVAPILQEKLYSRADTTILTSATLTTNGNFDYLKERLGVPDPREVITPSEFDFALQAILYVPRAFPEPRSQDYLPRALAEIREILEITDGHAFLLFTSFQQLESVYQGLSRRIPFPLLRQGEQPRNELLERFRSTPNAVLCATSSFWQGVDVQGDSLRAVIIDKLPFAVPSEPLVAARLHQLEQQGENAFLRYSVPQAVITLKQGLGRLIRSRQDRGVLAVFDSRLRTRRYGRLFLESLPNCPVTDNIEDIRYFYGRSASLE